MPYKSRPAALCSFGRRVRLPSTLLSLSSLSTSSNPLHAPSLSPTASLFLSLSLTVCLRKDQGINDLSKYCYQEIYLNYWMVRFDWIICFQIHFISTREDETLSFYWSKCCPPTDYQNTLWFSSALAVKDESPPAVIRFSFVRSFVRSPESLCR